MVSGKNTCNYYSDHETLLLPFFFYLRSQVFKIDIYFNFWRINIFASVAHWAYSMSKTDCLVTKCGSPRHRGFPTLLNLVSYQVIKISL